MRVQAQVLIAADQDRVFRFIARPENGPRWQEAAVSTRVTTEGPVRLGSQIEHVGRFLGMRLPTRAIVTVFDPNSAFGYDISSGLSPARMRYRLEPVPQGTQLTLSNEATLPVLARPFEALLQRSVQAMFERDVTRLRAAIEAEDAVVPSAIDTATLT
jgi:hypothetical protein